eukprot:5442674-Pleurochrysis_carterae.AAC.1
MQKPACQCANFMQIATKEVMRSTHPAKRSGGRRTGRRVSVFQGQTNRPVSVFGGEGTWRGRWAGSGAGGIGKQAGWTSSDLFGGWWWRWRRGAGLERLRRRRESAERKETSHKVTNWNGAGIGVRLGASVHVRVWVGVMAEVGADNCARDLVVDSMSPLR